MFRPPSIISRSFLKSSSFINKKGEHPPKWYVVLWNLIVLEKDKLNDDNWLYVGNESAITVEHQMCNLEIHEGGLPIIED